MQTDNGNTETGDSDIREIRLEPGIYDLTSDIKNILKMKHHYLMKNRIS